MCERPALSDGPPPRPTGAGACPPDPSITHLLPFTEDQMWAFLTKRLAALRTCPPPTARGLRIGGGYCDSVPTCRRCCAQRRNIMSASTLSTEFLECMFHLTFPLHGSGAKGIPSAPLPASGGPHFAAQGLAEEEDHSAACAGAYPVVPKQMGMRIVAIASQ